MADNDPMTQGACAAARAGCKELRTLENQNLVLNLRAEITGLLAETRRQIDAKFDQLLRDLGYVGETPADTAVHANATDHPTRRDEDAAVKERLREWVQRNLAWILALVFAALAGAEVAPWAKRVIEALTRGIEGLLT